MEKIENKRKLSLEEAKKSLVNMSRYLSETMDYTHRGAEMSLPDVEDFTSFLSKEDIALIEEAKVKRERDKKESDYMDSEIGLNLKFRDMIYEAENEDADKYEKAQEQEADYEVADRYLKEKFPGVYASAETYEKEFEIAAEIGRKLLILESRSKMLHDNLVSQGSYNYVKEVKGLAMLEVGELLGEINTLESQLIKLMGLEKQIMKFERKKWLKESMEQAKGVTKLLLQLQYFADYVNPKRFVRRVAVNKLFGEYGIGKEVNAEIDEAVKSSKA